MGHEVVNIQTIQADLGIIALGIGIESAVQLHRSPTLTGNYISRILGTVNLHPPLGTETAGNAVVALHITGQGGHDKVQSLGLCIELHISTQTGHVVEVGDETIGLHSKRRRQRHIKVGERHVLQVAVQLSFDTERIVWPALLHGLGKCRQEMHQVLATQLGIHAQAHLARVDGISQRQRQVHSHIDIGSRGLQTETWQAELSLVHHHRAGKLGEFKAAGFLQG